MPKKFGFPIFFLLNFLLFFWLLASPLLQNILVMGQVGNVALIKNRETKEIKAYKIGDPLFNSNLKIAQISSDRMVLKDKENTYVLGTKLSLANQLNQGHRSDLSATGDHYKEQGFERTSHGDAISIKVDSSFKDNVVKNLPNIVMEASSDIVPLPDGGVGIKIFNFSENSLFAKLGLNPTKDLNASSMITKINGVKIQNAVQAINALRQAQKKNQASLSFEIEEGGQTKQASINVS